MLSRSFPTEMESVRSGLLTRISLVVPRIVFRENGSPSESENHEFPAFLDVPFRPFWDLWIIGVLNLRRCFFPKGSRRSRPSRDRIEVPRRGHVPHPDLGATAGAPRNAGHREVPGAEEDPMGGTRGSWDSLRHPKSDQHGASESAFGFGEYFGTNLWRQSFRGVGMKRCRSLVVRESVEPTTAGVKGAFFTAEMSH